MDTKQACAWHLFSHLPYMHCPALPWAAVAFKQCSSDFCGLFVASFQEKNVTVEFHTPKLGKSALFWSRKVNFGSQVPIHDLTEKTEILEGDFEQFFSAK